MEQSFYGLMAYRLRTPCRKRIVGLLLFALVLVLGSPLRAQEAMETLILAFGDSLTAGYELPQDKSFPAQLESYLRRERGIKARVINGGVSGDTTSGGRARLDWVLDGLPRKPDLVVLELGANDALRGIEPDIAERNLAAILRALRERGIRTLLAGMKAPPNMGDDYEARFNAIYPRLAEQFDLLLYPFFLEGVATNKDLNLSDGMHPNAQGVAIIVESIVPYVERALARSVPKAAMEVPLSAGSESGG